MPCASCNPTIEAVDGGRQWPWKWITIVFLTFTYHDLQIQILAFALVYTRCSLTHRNLDGRASHSQGSEMPPKKPPKRLYLDGRAHPRTREQVGDRYGWNGWDLYSTTFYHTIGNDASNDVARLEGMWVLFGHFSSIGYLYLIGV